MLIFGTRQGYSPPFNTRKRRKVHFSTFWRKEKKEEKRSSGQREEALGSGKRLWAEAGAVSSHEAGAVSPHEAGAVSLHGGWSSLSSRRLEQSLLRGWSSLFSEAGAVFPQRLEQSSLRGWRLLYAQRLEASLCPETRGYPMPRGTYYPPYTPPRYPPVRAPRCTPASSVSHMPK